MIGHGNRHRVGSGEESKSNSRPNSARRPSSSNGSYHSNHNEEIGEDEEEAQRTLEVKIISGSHGHIIAILRAQVFPRPFVVDRVFRFHEYENTIAKRKIRLTGIDATTSNQMTSFPGDFLINMKYIHCVESANYAHVDGKAPASMQESSRVVVEWGSALQGGGYLPAGRHNQGFGRNVEADGDSDHIDMLIRYRCMESPGMGMFYLLLYNDPYQSQLHEVWQVVMHSRLRLDIHGTVGTPSTADLVIRGDQFPRRVKAFASTSQAQFVHFKPDNVFQMVPGAYNRVMTTVQPKYIGNRRALVNIVDVDSRELLSAWLVNIQATAPAIMRTYDVEVEVNKPIFKKILFKNPWDVRRKFILSSSDEQLLRPRYVQPIILRLYSCHY